MKRVTNHGNTWVVGLDLQPTGYGPLEFARWLKSSSVKPEHLRFVGLHVLEGFYLYSMLRHQNLEDLVRLAREVAEQDIDKAGATDILDTIHCLQGGNAEEMLGQFCEHSEAAALIIGRHAAREGRQIIRLGRVARRVLRDLDRPTFVVPPDLTSKEVGKGPVIAATDLTRPSVAGVTFAQRLARSVGRQLHLVHVVAAPQRYASRYMPAESLDRIRLANETAGQRAFEAWCREYDFHPDSMETLAGSVVGELLAVTENRDACTLVLGSRQLAMWERVLLSSVGSEVAAMATCPVALIPTRVAPSVIGVPTRGQVAAAYASASRGVEHVTNTDS